MVQQRSAIVFASPLALLAGKSDGATTSSANGLELFILPQVLTQAVCGVAKPATTGGNKIHLH